MWCHNKGELHLPCTGSHNRASWSWTVYLHNLQMLVQHLQDQIWFQCKIHFFKLLHEHLSSYWHIIFRHFKLQILLLEPQLYLEQQHQKLMAAELVIAYLTPLASQVLVAREHLWYVVLTLGNIVSIMLLLVLWHVPIGAELCFLCLKCHMWGFLLVNLLDNCMQGPPWTANFVLKSQPTPSAFKACRLDNSEEAKFIISSLWKIEINVL